ncbi:MAG: four helix bundle protein [Smithellaceae bacterium]|jgi:four helix bundle protein|nr:four helix bundle protein [Smithellaceae bacterium]
MATIEKFEDIKAWQNARELVSKIYTVTRNDGFARDFGLRDQIRRASVSILSNIAEGFERGGNKEFIQFLYIAKGSCAEVRAQLFVANDQKYISDEQFIHLTEICMAIGKMIAGLISYLQQSSLEGKKFKSCNNTPKKP